MLALEIDKLAKKYGNKQALVEVSLRVQSGEIYGFLGPNGAGKTTTMRCLMDFIRPDAGRITVFGKDAQRESVQARQLIGFLPAEDQLYASWTAKQHVDLIHKVRGRGRSNALALMEHLELNPKLLVKQMSSGNRQKLGLILAMMCEPKLLVLDEPTKGLDPLLQHKIYTLLQDYAAGGGTVFISSHNLAEVERICTNVGVIRAGKIVASESMATIRAMKIHLVTVTFIQPVTAPEIDFGPAEILSRTSTQAVLKVHSDINPLIAKLSRYNLADVEIIHAPLEDIFMEYYQEKP